MSNGFSISAQTTNASLNHISLGMSPLTISSLALTLLGPASFLFGWLVFALFGGPALLLAILVCSLPWIILTLNFGLQFLEVAFTAGGRNYRRTKTILRENQISISYYLRDYLGNNFIIVDEPRRLLSINGDVFSFDDVKKLSWESASRYTNRLDVTLKSGTKPIRSADLGSPDRLKSGFERLSNTLGFST